MRIATAITLTSALGFASPPAPATTYLICPDGRGDHPTIQEAINAASNGYTANERAPPRQDVTIDSRRECRRAVDVVTRRSQATPFRPGHAA